MAKLKSELAQYEKEMETMKPGDRVKGDVAFEIAWAHYPLKVGKKAAKRHFMKTVKTKGDYSRTVKAHNRYMEFIGEQRKRGFKIGIQHGSTFFNNWKDWAEMAEGES